MPEIEGVADGEVYPDAAIEEKLPDSAPSPLGKRENSGDRLPATWSASCSFTLLRADLFIGICFFPLAL